MSGEDPTPVSDAPIAPESKAKPARSWATGEYVVFLGVGVVLLSMFLPWVEVFGLTADGWEATPWYMLLFLALPALQAYGGRTVGGGVLEWGSIVAGIWLGMHIRNSNQASFGEGAFRVSVDVNGTGISVYFLGVAVMVAGLALMEVAMRRARLAEQAPHPSI